MKSTVPDLFRGLGYHDPGVEEYEVEVEEALDLALLTAHTCGLTPRTACEIPVLLPRHVGKPA